MSTTTEQQGLKSKGLPQLHQLTRLPSLPLLLPRLPKEVKKEVKVKENLKEDEEKEDGANEYEILTPLKDTQVSGVKWITQREKNAFGSSELLGGILGDPPGMGKTLCMIASIKKRPGHAFAPTLIIVPPQVISVWYEEFVKRTTLPKERIFIYYGPNRRNCEISENVLFVISTYAILRNECIRNRPKSESLETPFLFQNSRNRSAGTAEREMDQDGFIQGSVFNCEFYRVILDEAHIAKNHKTRVSISLTWLSAYIKWVVTATPKINSLDDEFGTFRFLGIFETWDDWRSVVPYTGQGIKASNLPRLKHMQQVIEGIKKEIMLRRPKILMNLPPKTDVYVPLEYSAVEREFYDQLQIYALSRIDSLEQTAEAHEFRAYASDIRSSVLKMIGRLKMATNSPFFVQTNMSRLTSCETIEEATQVLAFYNKRVNRQEECMICQDCSADYKAECGHKFCYKCWMTMFSKQDRKQRRKEEKEAWASMDAMNDNSDNSDSESIVESTVEGNDDVDPDDVDPDDLMENRFDNEAVDLDEDEAVRRSLYDDEGVCPQCQRHVKTNSLKKISTPVQERLIASLSSMRSSPKSISQIKSLGYDSPKVKKMKELVADNIDKTKLIIVSQSIPMLDYVNSVLEAIYPGQILRIDGHRKVEDRTENIRVFQDAGSKKRILLFSLTCNPEGITLTRATILIHLDHWWNKNGKVEQINDRIHRISQELPTTIYYLFMNQTIENKIFKLQDHKYQLINYDFDNLIAKPRLITAASD